MSKSKNSRAKENSWNKTHTAESNWRKIIQNDKDHIKKKLEEIGNGNNNGFIQWKILGIMWKFKAITVLNVAIEIVTGINKHSEWEDTIWTNRSRQVLGCTYQKETWYSLEMR